MIRHECDRCHAQLRRAFAVQCSATFTDADDPEFRALFHLCRACTEELDLKLWELVLSWEKEPES